MPILTIRTFRVEGPETPFCPVACNYKKHYNKVLDGMKYEWDEAKNRKNVAKHGLSFEDAEQVFVGSCVTFEDDRFAYGEERLITLGLLAGRLVVIAHAPRDDGTRIISMRKGNRREQKIYRHKES
jgi:uncharacterized DUF497 family protein